MASFLTVSDGWVSRGRVRPSSSSLVGSSRVRVHIASGHFNVITAPVYVAY